MEPASSNSPMPSAPAPVFDGPAADMSQMPQPVPSAPASSAPQGAQDSDLIEDEWVDAVKNVMHAYRNDPYGLADALSALRRDYLAKRYGRALKAAD